MLKACLFDLDGVITDTAVYHYQAWKKLANELGGDIDEEFNETLKGVDRQESFTRILKHINVSLTESEFREAMDHKNQIYLNYLATLSKADILPGIVEFMDYLQANSVKIIIASASKNAPFIIEKLGLSKYIDAVADPSLIANNKPAPDIFLLAAHLADAKYYECIGIEDSQAGLDALKAANIKSIAVGENLEHGYYEIASTKYLLELDLVARFNSES